jgi:3-phenylpropionate/cinnamic acid dioxygenase small subunit
MAKKAKNSKQNHSALAAPHPAAGNDDFEIVHQLWQATQEMAFYMDEEAFDSFLGFCANDLSYKITAYSKELLQPVVFLDLDREALQNLTDTINGHVRYPDKLLRHAGRPMVTAVDGDRVSCTTKVSIYHVNVHGEGGLYALVNYQDVFAMTEAGPKLMEREVAMETRTLPFGCHLPL